MEIITAKAYSDKTIEKIVRVARSVQATVGENFDGEIARTAAVNILYGAAVKEKWWPPVFEAVVLALRDELDGETRKEK